MSSVIYVLTDPRTQEIRYVGGTVQKLSRRLTGHIGQAKKSQHHCANWIKSLLNIGLVPDITIVQYLDINTYFECEKKWIYWFKGYIVSQETRDKIRLSQPNYKGIR